MHAPHAFGAERFEPPRFRFDIVGLDIDVYTAVVLDLLHFDVQIFGLRQQLPIDRARLLGGGPERNAQRLAPELRDRLPLGRPRRPAPPEDSPPGPACTLGPVTAGGLPGSALNEPRRADEAGPRG